MEITQLNSSQPYLFPSPERGAQTARPQGDIVNVHAPQLLADDEVEGVLNETIGMIVNDSAAALSMHSGLSESRVFALLGL